ncbi:DUF3945 domain-containing protein [Spirosoma luteum]|uniref:DUF3945 domain-containing protein n=1 Tax=Spirosoma luteum TaxID=431553 RepID=UPI0003679FB1|nr:DUF3945 domain-containing protein [Spirosoma luteum]
MVKQKKINRIPSLKIIPAEGAVPESEQIKEQFYELLLPEEYQELRQYLGNDGFLSNDEITAALRDGRLVKEELAEKLSALNLPSNDKTLQEKLTEYLWELHEIIQDPTLEKIRADQLYYVHTVQSLPDAERNVTDEERVNQIARRKPDRSIEIVHGGLLANFMHNFKKTYNLEEVPPIEVSKKTRYQWEDVEATLSKMGLTREVLAESGNLERLLRGEKTGLIDFKSEFNGQKTPLRGKVYLVKQGEEIKPYFQTQKQTLQIPEHYLGYVFSQEDKDTLRQKGELGKRVELEDSYTRKKFNGYIGLDQETNSLTVWRADRVYIPMQIKGVDVSKEQQETLRQGGAIRLAGLTSENGQKFSADIQVSAGKRSLSFSPPSESIRQTIDILTAKDLARPSDQLQGTSVGASTTRDKRPEQQQKKTASKQKGFDPSRSSGALDAPDVTLKSEQAKKKGQSKGQSQRKNKKAQKDQSLTV